MTNENIVIRPYTDADREEVQGICVATSSGAFSKNEDMQRFLLTTYCDYYIEKEPENCFVAADGNKAVGYVICAENTPAWATIFREEFASRISVLALQQACLGSINSLMECADEYPAHLHIDILPDYQRMGLGTKLMDALVTHLKKKSVPGLMFCVANDNQKAQAFYKKYGFAVLKERKMDTSMGILI